MKSQYKQQVYLICNAHLDPVWLWEWEEGAAEAISTFRTAAELCEKDDTFVFNHNEVTLYKWVQEYEPVLFRRIQNLVKAGRWHIMGGWYLQPDCNMPSGESFVRQIMLGKSYFKKYFGIEPSTAINFDPFGHTRGLVQILAKSGFDSYLFGRPQPHQKELPGEDFIWKGFDGSEIIATRYRGWYNTELGKACEIIEERMSDNADCDILAILWGVGNHGGGPSRYDLLTVNKMIEKHSDKNITHSTPEKYFSALKKRKDSLPEHCDDINPWAVGCYTSQIEIKQKHRLLENEIYMFEKMAVTAFAQGLIDYPYDEINEALCDLMVTEFHDVLPGSSIAPVEQAAIRQADHGLEIISRLKAKAFFALSSGQKAAKDGEIPILVYNPHPFTVKQHVECEFQLAVMNRDNNFHLVRIFSGRREVAVQQEKEVSNLSAEWRKRVVFYAELRPGMNRFDCRLERIPAPPPRRKVESKSGKIHFKTDDIEVVINTRTGLIDRYAVKGVDYLNPRAFELLVLNDNADPWGMLSASFKKVAGKFKLMSREDGTRFSGITGDIIPSVRVIEDGAVRTVIEAVFSYGDSHVVQQYKLPAHGTEIEVETVVYWQEKDKMLKLSVPTKLENCKYIGQTAYGVQDLPDNGDEAVAQKWVAVVSKNTNKAFTCINDGIYGSDFSAKGLRLSLLRSPAYSAHPIEGKPLLVADRYIPRIDQGRRTFKFWFNAGKTDERLVGIDREALVKNEKPFALSFFPPGGGEKTKPFVTLSDKAVQITALKRAEKSGNDIVIRLFEPTGKARKTTLSLPLLKKKISVKLTAFEIKSLRINLRTGKWNEVNLLE